MSVQRSKAAARVLWCLFTSHRVVIGDIVGVVSIYDICVFDDDHDNENDKDEDDEDDKDSSGNKGEDDDEDEKEDDGVLKT